MKSQPEYSAYEPPDCIFIHDLVCHCVIGVAHHERIGPQKLIISLDLHHDIRAAAQQADLSQTLNYDEISRFVVDFVNASRFGLLESLAESLIKALFAHFAMQGIRLSIQKPGAIVLTQKVGLCVTRYRADT